MIANQELCNGEISPCSFIQPPGWAAGGRWGVWGRHDSGEPRAWA